MDISPRHLPWKLERQLRDLAEQFKRQRMIHAWIRFAIVWIAILPGLALSVHLLRDTAIPMIVPIALFAAASTVLWWRWVYPASHGEPTREQIALYIDEQHPELENLAISSVSFSGEGQTTASEWLIDRFFEHAREAAGGTRIRDLVDHEQLRRQLAGLGAAWAVVLFAALLTVGQWDAEWIRSQLFVRTGPPPVELSIEPGDITVRHGVDQVVWLTTKASSSTLAIQWQIADGAWVTHALQPSRSEDVYFHTFTDIQSSIAYRIQAEGAQSPTYRIDVWTPPEVAWIDAQYHYPDYTGLAPKSATAIDQIEGPVGTLVDLTVHTNQPVDRGELTFTFDPSIDLTPSGANALTARVEIGAPDTLRANLFDSDGKSHLDTRAYPVEPAWDNPPEIAISFPRGDDEATALEEIPFAFSIEDDFGIWSYGIQYEIAGREPVRRTLGEKPTSVRSAEATDLLRLEELDLKPGDFLTWYVWADDRHPDRTEYEQLSDPFFLEIRPFRRSFSEAVSNAGQQGGGGQEGAMDQKQVIVATWNLRKQANQLVDIEFEERQTAIVTAQQNVLEAALGNPMIHREPKTLERLKMAGDQAVQSLGEATWEDPGKPLTDALRHEQIVHQILLSLAPDQLTVGRQQGGAKGGRGGNRQRNRELDALELTRRRDFAEESTTRNQQLGQSEEVRKGIEDLAKRQTFINQDLSDLISELEQDIPPEEQQRRLERLIDEQRQNLSELEQLESDVASNRMDREQRREARSGLAEAGRQMRQTLRDLEEREVQRARNAGSGALRELADVEEQLGALSQEAAAERLNRLSESMDQLAERQKEILEGVREGQTEPTGLRSLEEPEDTPLVDQKSLLAEAFEQFMNEAGDLAEKSEATQGLASRKLNDWLRETSRDGIYEDIENGKDLVRRGAWSAAERHEEGVLEKLEDAKERLALVQESLITDELDGMRRALSQVEGLVSDGEGEDPLADPGTLSDFMEGDYREWMDDLRSAESLLGEQSGVRRSLTGVREDIDRLRRQYRRDKVPPQYDLVYNEITKPLKLAAEELRQEIARETGEFAVGIERLDAVPERYRKQVAEYFKALSEIDTSAP